MDPKQCLIDAQDYLTEMRMDDLDHEHFLHMMNNYWEWRSRGGFEPDIEMVNGVIEPGDIFHDNLRKRYTRICGRSKAMMLKTVGQ